MNPTLKPPTYCYRAGDVTPAATATDVFTLTNPANGSKLLTLKRATLSGTATAATILDFYVTKRVTATTGGTATNPTPTRFDSNDPVATGVLNLYSANATALGSGQALDGDHLYLAAGAATAGAPVAWVRDYSQAGENAPVLRPGETYAFNLNGAAIPAGASLYMFLEWTEQ